MKVTFDEQKRRWTLQERGLDFLDVPRVMAGPVATLEDDRFAYTEARFQTYGLLDERLVMFAWTPKSDGYSRDFNEALQ